MVIVVESGGALVVKYENNEKEILLGGNVVGMVPAYDALYVFTGLSHLSASEGRVSVIRGFTKPLRVEGFTLLPWAPEVVDFDVSRGLFTVVGDSGVMEVFIEMPFDEGGAGHKNSQYMNVYFVKNGWRELYPNSVVRKGVFLLIGMRDVVAVVRLAGVSGVAAATYYMK